MPSVMQSLLIYNNHIEGDCSRTKRSYRTVQASRTREITKQKQKETGALLYSFAISRKCETAQKSIAWHLVSVSCLRLVWLLFCFFWLLLSLLILLGLRFLCLLFIWFLGLRNSFPAELLRNSIVNNKAWGETWCEKRLERIKWYHMYQRTNEQGS